jgi:hypothetical protein
LVNVTSNSVLVNADTACGTPLNATTERPVKPVPLILSVIGPVPAPADAGTRLVIAGVGLETAVTVKVATFDCPPPGGGLMMITEKAPAVARSEEVNVIVNWLLLTILATCGIPLNVTEEEGVNPPPLIVTITGLLPDGADDGDMLAIEG